MLRSWFLMVSDPKMPILKVTYFFLFTFWLISKQTADPQKNVEGIEWRAIDDLRFGINGYEATGQYVFCKQTADLTIQKSLPSKIESCLGTGLHKRIFWDIGSENICCIFWVRGQKPFPECLLEFHSTVVRNTAHSAYT